MIKEELTKLLMEAYERGQSDLIKSCQETVSIAVDTAILAEREAIAQMIEDAPALMEFAQNDQGGCLMCGFTPKLAAKTIRARGDKHD